MGFSIYNFPASNKLYRKARQCLDRYASPAIMSLIKITYQTGCRSLQFDRGIRRP